MIKELEHYFKESDLLEIYKNIRDKEEDIEITLNENTMKALNVMKLKYGKEYRLDIMYDQLAHYFVNMYINNVKH